MKHHILSYHGLNLQQISIVTAIKITFSFLKYLNWFVEKYYLVRILDDNA